VIDGDRMTATVQNMTGSQCLGVGLSVSEAAKLCNYLHLRKAECLVKKSAFQRANYDKSLDFMDSLEDDIPRGILSLHTMPMVK